MNLSTKKKIVLSYLVASLFILAILAFLNYGPFWHRNIFDLPQQDIPLKWYEYVQRYLGTFLIPAFYGLYALIPLRKLQLGYDSGFGFFIGALVLGVIVSTLSWFGSGFSRIDCGNDCAAYIPSYHADAIMNSLTWPPLVIVPGIMVYLFKQTKRQK